MPEAVIRSENYVEGYRLTTTAGGLQIDTIRADPRPLRLDLKQLARLAYGSPTTTTSRCSQARRLQASWTRCWQRWTVPPT